MSQSVLPRGGGTQPWLPRARPVTPLWGLSRASRQRLSLLVVLLAWGWAVLPRVIQTILGSKYRNTVGESVAPDNLLASYANYGLAALLVGLSLIVLPIAFRDPLKRPLLGLVLVEAPWLALTFRDLSLGDHLSKITIVYPFFVLALWALQPSISLLRNLGYLCAGAAVFNVLLGFLWPAKGVFYYSSGDLVLDDKATLSSGILIGFLTHGNNLGVFATLSLPLVFLIRNRWTKSAMVAVTLFAVFWSASRSSMIACVITLLAYLAVTVLPTDWRRVFGPLIALVPFGLVIVLPFLTTDPSAYTNRGFIWQQSLAYWETNPVFGLGSGFYGDIGATSERIATTAFHGHNQMIQLLTTGGFVVAGLTLMLIVFLAAKAGRLAARGHTIGVVLLAAVAGTCLFERSLSFVDNYNMFPVTAVPLAVLAFAREGE